MRSNPVHLRWSQTVSNLLPVELSRLNFLLRWYLEGWIAGLPSVFHSFSTLVMQLSATIIAFLFSLLSLRVLGSPHRMIRPRPGSLHRGSGLGGGGIVPFPSKTHTKRSLWASTSNSPAKAGVIPAQATLTPLQTSSTPLLSTYLSLHNEFRKRYAANPLNWSTTLASAAQQWASNCQWGHSSMAYGENIAAGTAENFTAQSAFNMWASEARELSFCYIKRKFYEQIYVFRPLNSTIQPS